GLGQTVQLMLERAPEAIRDQFLAGNKNVHQADSHDLVRAWKQGVPLTDEIMELWHHHIAAGLRSIINLLDPDTVVIGGGMAQFVNFDLLMKITRPLCLPSDIDLRPATLGNKAGIVGAA